MGRIQLHFPIEHTLCKGSTHPVCAHVNRWELRNHLQTPHFPPSLAQCLQYLQFLQAWQGSAPVRVAEKMLVVIKVRLRMTATSTICAIPAKDFIFTVYSLSRLASAFVVSPLVTVKVLSQALNPDFSSLILHGELFYSLREAQVVIEKWRVVYNTLRPHSALGYRSPAPAACSPWCQIQFHDPWSCGRPRCFTGPDPVLG
jgi:transposase InsO family protein